MNGLPTFLQGEKFKEMQEKLDARKYDTAVLALCKDGDLCNGTVRLAEISTMMLVLPAALVLISFFLRL
jgi:hypothetical protein